jgi:uncharacterized membrane protein YhaH (DUF805 family)
MDTLMPHSGDKSESSATVEWHYAVGTERQGPVSEHDLIAKIKSGELDKKTKIWKEGLPKWILLGNTGFAAFLPKSGPPPLTEVDTAEPREDRKLPASPPPTPMLNNSQKPISDGYGGRTEHQWADPGNEIREAMNWYIKVFKNYAVFNGRARRKEYWIFVLTNAVVSFALMILDSVLDGSGILTAIFGLSILVPNLAVSVRRMHDTNHSGWFILVPIYNLILAAWEGQRGDNRFGADPKAITSTA